MSKTLPLKLRGTDGSLKEISTSEKNYLAYLASLQLANQVTEGTGNLSTTPTGNILAGTFTDTNYNEVDGTHPASQITSTTVSTPLYQVSGVAEETSSDWRKPVGYNARSLYEMKEVDYNILIDDLNGTIATNELPGSFRLAQSPPSADWSVHISAIFTDDSSGTVYNIYRRDTISSFGTPVNMVGVKRTNGSTGTYEGLKEISNIQAQYSLGQRAQTRRAIAGAVGSYQLMDDTQGSPTGGGAWISRGSAVSTTRTTSEVPYTRTRSSNYTLNRISTYSRNSILNKNIDYIGNYVGNYARAFVGDYARNIISTFAGDYIRTTIINRNSSFSRTTIQSYTGNYTGNYARTFVGDYARTYVGNYSRNFAGDFIRNNTINYTRGRVSEDYAGNYSRIVVDSFTGNYSRTFIGNFAGNFAGTRVADVIKNSTVYYSRVTGIVNRIANFAGNYTLVRNSSYTGPNSTRIISYAGDFVGTSTGYYGNTYAAYYAGIRDYTRVSTGTNTESYTISYMGPAPWNEPGMPPEQIPFSRTRTSIINTYYTGNYSAADYFSRVSTAAGTLYRTAQPGISYSGAVYFARNVDSTRTSSRILTSTRISILNPNGAALPFTGNFVGYLGYYTGNFVGTTTRKQVLTFTGTPTTYTRINAYTSTRVSTKVSAYTPISTNSFSRIVINDYARTYVGNYSTPYARPFAGNYVGNYAHVSTRTSIVTRSPSYTRTSTANRISTYSGVRTVTFTGNYTGDFIRNTIINRSSAYSRNSVVAFIANRSSAYTRDSILNRNSSFVGNYARAFAGNFIRNRIINSTTSRVSTYTRSRASTYVRDSILVRASNFAGDYTGNYARTFVGDYGRSFTGNYTGTTIQPATTANKTFILYVRTI